MKNIKHMMKRILIACLLAGILCVYYPADCVAATDCDIKSETEAKTAAASLLDVDYVENGVFAVCESESEAISIAESYFAVTGHEFILEEYAYGVAVYSIDEEKEFDLAEGSSDFQSIYEECDAVTAAVSIGLNPDYELEEVYPDYYMELASVEKPNNLHESFNDPFTKSDSSKYQWYHEMLEDKFLWEEMDKLKEANADPFDDIEYYGELPLDFLDNLNNEVVAVIDSGINGTHEDFTLQGGGSVIVSPIDVTGVTTGYEDMIGHGSNVAGIIGNVADNALGGRGIAGGVKIMPINVCPNASGTGITTSSSIRAINLIAEKKEAYLNGEAGGLNICVVNMSLGGTAYYASFNAAIQKLIDLGITVVAAATNSNSSNYAYPASYDNVISVASVNSYYIKSGFSNYGDKVSISAPGGERTRIIEEIGIMDEGEECFASYKGAPDRYDSFHGTSQACPMVAATAALLYAKNPDITPYEVKAQMERTAVPVYGSYQIGAGCLNVAAALGIDRGVAAPVADKESSETMPLNFEVNITIPGVELSNYEGSIYYTLDGSDPDIRNSENTYELNLLNPEPIRFAYDELLNNQNETLKIMSVLFGKKSEIVSYQYKYYLGDDIPIIKRADGIKLDDGRLRIAADKSLSLKMYDKTTNEEIKASWTSANPMIADTDDKGNIYGIREGYETVITATPLSERYCPIEIIADVKPAASYLEIDAVEDDCIKMYCNDTYSIENMWKIYPLEAAQTVTYSSSNPSIASIDAEGMISANIPGMTEIKISAVDGSGISETISVKCEPSLSEINIENISGREYLPAGGTMKFSLSCNTGYALPKDADIYWDFSDTSKMYGAQYYMSINHKTGTVTAKSNSYVTYPFDVQVEATSLNYGISDLYEFTLYPRLKSISLNKNYSDSQYGCYQKNGSVFCLKSYKSITLGSSLGDLINTSPAYFAKSLSFASSNENVAYIVPPADGPADDGIGILKTRAPGNAIITISSTDGSGLKLKLPITVVDTVAIKNTTGIDNISPGKSLSFKIVTDGGKTVPSDSVQWSISGVKTTSGFDMSDYFDMSQNGKLSMRAATYEEIRDFLNRNKSKMYDYLIVSAKYYPSLECDFYYSASKIIDICPVLTTMVKVKDEEGTAISEINFSHTGEKTTIYPYSLPDCALNCGYTYRSSNSSVAKVNSDGEIEAISKGSAYIDVFAGDLSGKKARLKVNVKYPYVKKINLSEGTVNLRTSLCEGVSDPADSIYSESADFRVLSIEPFEAEKKVEVTSLNSNVARVIMKDGCDESNPVYTIIPVNKGTTKIKVMALDGSKKSAYIKVKVVNPNTGFTIDINNGLHTLKASASEKIKVSLKGTPSNKGVKYDFYGVGSTDAEREASIAEMKKYVSLNSATGLIKVKNAKTIGMTERFIYVYATAKDDWHYSSAPLQIRIKPGIVYISELFVKSLNSLYSVGSGSKVSMKAVCNTDATEKKITWHIYDEDDNNQGMMKALEGSLYATVNSSGVVSVKKGLQNRRAVFVVAKAADGGAVSAPVKIDLYPQIKSLKADSYPLGGAKSVNKGEYLTLKVSAKSCGLDKAFEEYKVTYSSGYAKVYLEKNPASGNYDGTLVSVYGVKKGRTKIVFTSKDGSSKKVTVYINTL